ncbi:MAG: D-tagatose 3-epimerase [Gemmatimonadetes bacterium]|nr:D-tagatose 3-epimerase [Gemmatimonadota bacterium]
MAPSPEAAKLTTEIGYTGIELAPYTLCDVVTDLEPSDRSRIRREIEDAGIEVAGLHWLLANTPFRLNSPDRVERQAAGNYLVELVDFCADVGGDTMVFGSPAQRDPTDGFDPEEAWAWTVECMRSVGERADDRGVVFCIEPLGTSFVTWIDDAIRLVGEVDRPGFAMMVDCKAMVQDDRWSVSDQILHAHGSFHHVHVNDPNRLGPGMGELDFDPILNTLAKLDYQRWVSVEAFDFQMGREKVARTSFENMKRLTTT